MVHKARLRKVGGSVMLASPPALLHALHLAPNAAVVLSASAGRLIVEPQDRRGHALDELLARCDMHARRPRADCDWADGAPAGHELL